MAIYVGILGIIIIIAGILFSRPSDKKIDLQKLIYGASFVLVGVCLLFWASLIRVGKGYIGIVKLGGKIQHETLACGWHIVNPLAKVTKLNSHTQCDKIFSEVYRGKINNDTLKIVGADGSIIKLGLTIVYHIVPSDAAKLYKEGGIHYKNDLVYPLVYDMANRDAKIYDASCITSDKWSELQANLNKDIQSVLRKHGMRVEQVLVSNFTTCENAAESPTEIFLAQQGPEKPPVVPAEKRVSLAIERTENTTNMVAGEISVAGNEPPQIIIKPGYADELDILNDNLSSNKTTTNKPAEKESAALANKDNSENSADSDCRPMDDKSFGSAKQMITSVGDNTFNILTTAKKLITTNCFTSEQVADFVSLLPTEDAKLEFAKIAYLRTVDRNEFYEKLAGNFDKKSNKQLKRYIINLLHHSRSRTKGEGQAGLMNVEDDIAMGPMNDETFQYFKQMVLSSPSKDSKLSVARKIVDCHFLTSEQVLEVVKLLPETDARLEFAEEAYVRTTDKRMFVKVANYFDNSTRRRLDNYVMTMYASR